MDQRMEFAMKAVNCPNFRELCREYGISAKTGYKWRKRFKESGFEGLNEQSRRPAAAHTPGSLSFNASRMDALNCSCTNVAAIGSRAFRSSVSPLLIPRTIGPPRQLPHRQERKDHPRHRHPVSRQAPRRNERRRRKAKFE